MIDAFIGVICGAVCAICCYSIMIAAQVQVFYRRVIKDLIVKLSSRQQLVRELEQQNVFLNQIEQSMLDKLQNPLGLFKRLTCGYNEIEKEMMSRYATLEEIIYHEKNNRLSNPSSNPPSLTPHDEQQDDLDSYSDNLSHHPPQEPERSVCNSIKSNKRALESDFSLQDLSEFDGEHGDTIKRLRENAKIHILGTYQCNSKKHHFKHDTTQIALENVFIKVEGVAREIFLSKLHCLSRKRLHRQ